MLAAMYRDYRPGLGRWTRRDPAGFVDGYNLFQYAGNSPLARVDLSGLAWQWAVVAGILRETAAGRLALDTTGHRPPSTFAGSYIGLVSGQPETGGPWEHFSLELRGTLDDEGAAAAYVHEAKHVQQFRGFVMANATTLEKASVSASVDQRYGWEEESEIALFEHLAQLESLGAERKAALRASGDATGFLVDRTTRALNPEKWKQNIRATWNYPGPLVFPCRTKLPLPVNPFGVEADAPGQH